MLPDSGLFEILIVVVFGMAQDGYYFNVHIFLVNRELYPQNLISLRIQNSAYDLHITEKNWCSCVQRRTAVKL